MKNIICRAGILILVALSFAGFAWSASTVTLLYHFDLSGSTGRGHVSDLIVGPHGSLYGTTRDGGAYGYGAVFRLKPPASPGGAWKETVLFNTFSLNNGAGAFPMAGVVLYQGALYGTTQKGGSNGYGTVFQLKPPTPPGGAWNETVLHNFTGGNDGAYPIARLAVGADGGLYGTTSYGGAGASCDASSSCGTVFKEVPPDKLIPRWTLSTLHSFPYNYPDGQYPRAGVIFGN